MLRRLWNDGWEFRPRVDRVSEITGESTEWAAVTLPHDAMLTAGRTPDGSPGTGYFRGGTFEYRKQLRAPNDAASTRVMLELEAVYRDAVVLVNGEWVVHRPYGYSPIVVDLGAHLRPGDGNEIRVECQAGNDSRWYSGAGIHRDAWLVVGDAVHIALDGVRVSTPDVDDRRALVMVATTVENDLARAVDVTVDTELLGGDGTVVARDITPATVAAHGRRLVRQRIALADQQRWSVDSPHLYTCRATLRRGDDAVDEARTTFGIRTLQVDAVHGLRINGERVDLRGACVHHDNGVIGAAAFARAEERRVELLKGAGFNALRSAHNPMSRAMLDACDRLGMLVMDEAFDVWTRSKSDDDYARAFPEWWEADVAAMVDKDFNHPSVIMYSTGNEIIELGTPSGTEWSHRLAEAIRTRDSSRFVTNGVQALFAALDDLGELFSAANVDADPEAGVNAQMTQLADTMERVLARPRVDERISPACATLDVAGYNYLESRWDIDHELHPHRVIVGSETHPRRVDANWAYIATHRHVIGEFVWTGWDYLGEAGLGRTAWDADDARSGYHGAYPWLAAWCGDLDIAGNRRPSSYLREIVYGLRSEPFIAVERAGHVGARVAFATPWGGGDAIASWTWPGHEGERVRIEVYSPADEVEVVVNGRPVGRSATGPDRGHRTEFVTDYEPGEVTAIAYTAGEVTGRTTLRSASGTVQLALTADRPALRSDGHDLAYVTIALVDEAGTLDTSADRLVRVAIDGPAVLQGLGSGNPRTEESFLDDTHTTFDGRALAVVRPTAPGDIVVTASADGCEVATLVLHAS